MATFPRNLSIVEKELSAFEASRHKEEMETPQISRSGRVLKKSAKVKEMEDLDINELEMQGKTRKKSKSEDYEDFDDKRVAPIKIPKISLNLSSASKRKASDSSPSLSKMSFLNTKGKPDPKRSIYQDSSADESKSESSSVSSESSSSSPSSSDDSDGEVQDMRQRYSNIEMKPSLLRNIQSLPPQQEKVIVEPYRQCDSPDTYADNNNDMPEDGSEDETSDSALVIAEESNDSHSFASRGQKTGVSKKRPEKKDPTYAPRRGGQKKRTASKNPRSAKKKPVGNSKPLTAYMLWCTENRKKIVASMGNTGFGNIGKKLGETWQALPDKEKMAWRRKAKRIALKNSSGLISTGPSSGSSPKGSSSRASSVNDDVLKGIAEGSRVLGTSAIDSAAYLKLLGDSLSVIGQRLTEHEGQLAVSGIFSVLLDTILCVIGPLICLTSETPVLNSCPQEVTRRTLDSIAYFMPGL